MRTSTTVDDSTAPATSRVAGRGRSDGSRSRGTVSAAVIASRTSSSQKMARQLIWSVSTPPTSGPMPKDTA